MSAICIVYIICLPLYVIFLIKPAAGREEASNVFSVVGEDADSCSTRRSYCKIKDWGNNMVCTPLLVAF